MVTTKKTVKKKAPAKKAIAKVENNLPATQQQESPAAMMIRAKEAGLDAEQMKQMLEVQKEWEANEALKAFNLAVASFRENPPTVYKDKKNAQYGDSGYVSLGNMVNTVSAALSEYGLTIRWSFGSDENNIIICTCTLSHKLGHAESVTVDGPPDDSGKKNALQARKSTRTYLKLESFEAVTGMASVEANMDDDGNAYDAVPVLLINDDQIANIRALIDEIENMSEDDFLKVARHETVDSIPADRYNAAIGMLERKRDMQ